jgi:hypothetical protein
MCNERHKEGTKAAPAIPASPSERIMTCALGLNVMMVIAMPKSTTTVRNMVSAPKRWHSLAPSMTRPATESE